MRHKVRQRNFKKLQLVKSKNHYKVATEHAEEKKSTPPV